MPSLLNAARHLFDESGMEFIWLDDPMFPDPIIAVKDAETLKAIHTLMCAATGADPAYVNVRRVADWLTEGHAARKAKAAHAS
jgi:hypothetical protein